MLPGTSGLQTFELDLSSRPYVEFSLHGDPNMLLPIEKLDLPPRPFKWLRNPTSSSLTPIYCVGQLLALNQKEIMEYGNIGATAYSAIEKALAAKGYSVGEGRSQVGACVPDYGDLHRDYKIDENVPRPTDWVAVPGRDPIVPQPIAKKSKENVLTDKFATCVQVGVPHAIKDEETIEQIRHVFQRAFELAVKNAIDHVRYPTRALPLQRELRKSLRFNENASYPVHSCLNIAVTLPEETLDMLSSGFLRKVASSLDTKITSGLVARILDPNS